MSWCVVIRMALPYSVLIEDGRVIPVSGTMYIPFGDRKRAEDARDSHISVYVDDVVLPGEDPKVVQGQVEPADILEILERHDDTGQ